MKQKTRPVKMISRVVICILVLLIGVVGMSAFARMKKSPDEISYTEPSLRVETLQVRTEDVQVIITGYGEVKSLDTISIAPEVSGKVMKVHPRLETGELIGKGETLFSLDARDYKASLEEAQATVRQLESSILRLHKQREMDQERIKTLKRNRDLAKAQYDRLHKLFEEDNVGARSGVDQSEQSFNSYSDQVDQMTRSLELYPIQIQEAESSLEAAKARLKSAGTRLERCTVKAPFNGRVKQVAIEKGQYVSPGMTAVTLANDSILEIHVPLDSRDAAKWLRFNSEHESESIAWFNGLEQVKCRIRWTEANPYTYWQGTLHRVLKFDQQTRTLTVAVRVKAEDAFSSNRDSLPLVEGMFCEVEIPGKRMSNVIRLPRTAVSFEDTVCICVDKRLKTIPVQIVREEGEDAFISDGLTPGDIVIVTKLTDPLENSLIEIE